MRSIRSIISIAFWLCGGLAFAVACCPGLLPRGSFGAESTGPSAVAEGDVDTVPLPRFGWWGHGDFDKKILRQKGGYLLQLKNVTTRDFSGYSREWQNGEKFPLRGCNTLVMTVEGAANGFESSEADKLIKWFVKYAGCTGDETLICSDKSLLSEDPEFVGPSDGTFEYKLPEAAVKHGAITKIGFTLFHKSTYKNVKFKAHLARKQPEPRERK